MKQSKVDKLQSILKKCSRDDLQEIKKMVEEKEFSLEMNTYSAGKIYKIIHLITGEIIYIGSTIAELISRWYGHIALIRKDPNFKLSKQMSMNGGVKMYTIVLIENYPCRNKTELLKREEHFIRLFKPICNIMYNQHQKFIDVKTSETSLDVEKNHLKEKQQEKEKSPPTVPKIELLKVTQTVKNSSKRLKNSDFYRECRRFIIQQESGEDATTRPTIKLENNEIKILMKLAPLFNILDMSLTNIKTKVPRSVVQMNMHALYDLLDAVDNGLPAVVSFRNVVMSINRTFTKELCMSFKNIEPREDKKKGKDRAATYQFQDLLDDIISEDQ